MLWISGAVKNPNELYYTGWNTGVLAGTEKGVFHHSRSLQLPVTMTIKQNRLTKGFPVASILSMERTTHCHPWGPLGPDP